MVGAIGRHHLLAARRPVGRQSGTLSGRHQHPNFADKAGRILDLYARTWEDQPLQRR